MLVFCYDRTFEGLLSALFDAYSLKVFPDTLIGEGEPEPMFTGRVHRVETTKEKADRVWKGLGKKLSREVCNMLGHVWLSEEEGSDYLLMRYMRKVFDQGGGLVTDFADDDMLQVKKLAQKVHHEAQYLSMFVRFQKAGDDTYFAPVSPRFNALPLAIRHFRERFSDQKWLIYDMKRGYGYHYDLERVLEVTLLEGGNFPGGRLDQKLMAEDEKMFQELWKGYFKAMTIKERINPKLHARNLPRRFWKYLIEKN